MGQDCPSVFLYMMHSNNNNNNNNIQVMKDARSRYVHEAAMLSCNCLFPLYM